MSPATQQQRTQTESGVYRRRELERVLRSSEDELRALIETGAIDDLLDADDGDAEFEY